jgi:hypothetical protein
MVKLSKIPPANLQGALTGKTFSKATRWKYRGNCVMSGIEILLLDTNAVIKLLDDKEKSRFLDEAFPNNEKACYPN